MCCWKMTGELWLRSYLNSLPYQRPWHVATEKPQELPRAWPSLCRQYNFGLLVQGCLGSFIAHDELCFEFHWRYPTSQFQPCALGKEWIALRESYSIRCSRNCPVTARIYTTSYELNCLLSFLFFVYLNYSSHYLITCLLYVMLLKLRFTLMTLKMFIVPHHPLQVLLQWQSFYFMWLLYYFIV